MNTRLRYLLIPMMPIVLFFGFHDSTAQVVVSRSVPSDSVPDVNDTITVAINIDMTGMSAPDTLLGSYSADLDWNPNILTYVSNSGPLQGFTGFVNTTNADTGHIRFNGAKPTGQNGVFDVLVVTFVVIGSPGQSTILDLKYTAMAAAYTFNNLFPYLNVVDGILTVAGAVGIDDLFDDQIPMKYELAQNFPNPFNPATQIRFGLPKASTVEINLFNVMGQKVATILDEYQSAGFHTVNFDASHLAGGVYFFSIKAGDFKDVKKMILMK